jgi:Type II secretion system (T2SS), protein E, N-terminal domain
MALRIGDMLLQRGLISLDKLERALAAQRRWGTRIGVCLVRLGFIQEGALAAALSDQLGIPLAAATAFDRIPREVIQRVPSSLALAHKLIPIAINGNAVHVCLADPQNLARLDDIAFALGCPIQPVLATEMLIERALLRYYPAGHPSETVAPLAPLPSVQSDVWAGTPSEAREWRVEMRRAARTTPAEGAAPAAKKAVPEKDAAPVVPAVDDATAERQKRALALLGRALATGGAPAPAPARTEPAAVAQPPAAEAALTDKPPARPPEVLAAPSPGKELTPYTALAAVASREDLATALCSFFGTVFPNVCLLETDGRSGLWLGGSVGGAFRTGPRAPARISFGDVPWIVDHLTRSHLDVLEQVEDPPFVALLERLGLATTCVSLLAVTDEGVPSHALFCQGLTEWEIKAVSSRLGTYLRAAADAVRMLALRQRIVNRGAREAAGEPDSDHDSPRHDPFPASRPVMGYSLKGDGAGRRKQAGAPAEADSPSGVRRVPSERAR